MDTQAKLSVGDTVTLKSGGPLMTIDKLDGDRATCIWFVKDQPKTNEFAMASLQATAAGSSLTVNLNFAESGGKAPTAAA